MSSSLSLASVNQGQSTSRILHNVLFYDALIETGPTEYSPLSLVVLPNCWSLIGREDQGQLSYAMKNQQVKRPNPTGS